MRAHVIEFGKVVNTIEVESLNFGGLHLVDAELGGTMGDTWDGNGFTTPAKVYTRDELKTARQAVVDAITVEVDGMVFDGDEVSQGRMARALTVAQFTGQASATWVLHDNTAVVVTKEQLATALALSIQAQAAVWVIQP